MDGINPWEEFPEIWPTKASYFSWLRGCLRRGIWEKSPVKLKFKNESCGPPPDSYTGKGRSGANCALTGVWECKSRLEVDHKKGGVSLNDWEDIPGFVAHLSRVSYRDLQLVTKHAHKIKSYAERKGISFEQAVIEKKVIEFTKESAPKQKKILESFGISGEGLKNGAARKESMREILIGGELC